MTIMSEENKAGKPDGIMANLTLYDIITEEAGLQFHQQLSYSDQNSFAHGFSMPFLPSPVYFLAPCDSATENRKKRPKKLCFKATTRAMETYTSSLALCPIIDSQLDLAKKHGPLMHLRLGEVSTVVVSTAEFAKVVMQTHDIIFASRPEVISSRIISYNSTNIGFSPYGDYWKRLRKICTKELSSAKRVQSYRSIREKQVLNLIEWIGSRAGSPINLTQKVMSATYSITSQAAFGNQWEDQEDFMYVMKEVIKVASGFNVADVFPSFKVLHMISGVQPKVERLQKRADRILENIIKEHLQATATTKTDEAQVQEDLVDVLLKFHVDHYGSHELSLTPEK